MSVLKLAICILSFLVACGAFAAGSGNNLLPDIPIGSAQVRLVVIADAGTFPITAIKGAGDGSGRLFVVQSNGVIRIFENGNFLVTPFLNAPAAPAGRAMSGIAFHPDFPSDRRFFVTTGEALPNASTPHYLPPQNLAADAFDNVLVEYEIDSGNADIAEPATRRELLRIRKASESHNLNDITFDGDGYLILAVGDGGNTRTGSPTNYNTNAELTTNPYGAFLRIDVDTIGPNGRYGIPADNPFANGVGGNVPEIYAWGVRNPWRITTDRDTGLVYAGVNGDITIEWVLRLELGKNYGWDVKEGGFLYNPLTGEATVDPNPDPSFTPPLGQYDHNNAQAFGSIIGGFVYRGTEIPELGGRYVFHDWVAGRMVSMDIGTGAMELVALDAGGQSLIATSLSNSEITWGEDDDGELYLGRANGQILKVLRSLPHVYADLAAETNGNGTLASPFDNIGDAVEDAATAGIVHLFPGSTPETFSGPSAINRPMTLQNDASGSGNVVIGSFGARSLRRSNQGFTSSTPSQ